MDSHVAQLENDTLEINATLGRLEPAITLISAQMPHVATKSDVSAVTGATNVLAERVAAMDGRLGRVERSMESVIYSAIGKSIGPWQLPAVLASCIAVVIAGFALLSWIQGQHLFGRS